MYQAKIRGWGNARDILGGNNEVAKAEICIKELMAHGENEGSLVWLKHGV